MEPLAPTVIGFFTGDDLLEEEIMRAALRKTVIIATAMLAIVGATVALPGTADARWGGHGGWHGGGHWRGGGWGWGGVGLGLGTGLALGLAAGPAWGGYYGGPYGYGPSYGAYAYGGDCVMRRRWVVNRYGHRVLRWVRACY
jgi:hypothetical protein